MDNFLTSALVKVENIKKQRLTIYSEIEVEDPNLWFTKEELESLLHSKMLKMSFTGLPLRTRSKEVKSEVCKILGYPIPTSFIKTQPRFLGQNFDTYVQKANNLQVWNEELDPTRRYVLIQLNNEDIVTMVKVVTGCDLEKLDTTGTLTHKFQARLNITASYIELISTDDTDNIKKILTEKSTGHIQQFLNPTSPPTKDSILPLNTLFELLKELVGVKFRDSGIDQERNRGAELHKLLCIKLGYNQYNDDGQFPDIKNQILEVKLQTSPTIDLGLINPNSELPLSIPKISGITIRHCDVRYALFYGKIQDGEVLLTHFYLTTGKDFFSRFNQFGGKVVNKKIQIPLKSNFFKKTEDTLDLDFPL